MTAIADVLASPRYRPVLTRLALEVGAVAAAENIRLEPFDGFDPGAFQPNGRIGRSDHQILRRHGGAQPQIGQKPFRHLA